MTAGPRFGGNALTLVYRAVWEDDWADPISVLDDEFSSWCRSKRIDTDLIPRRGSYEVEPGTVVDIRRADVRSEERRVGKECVSTCRLRGSQSNPETKTAN